MMRSRASDYLGPILRIVVSFVLVGAIAYAIGTRETIAQLEVARWETIALVVAILATHVFVIAPRWALILAALGCPTRSSVLIGSVFVGFLLNQILPTAVGGDAIRVWRVRHLGVPLDLAIHSVLIDRTSGIAVVLAGTALLLPAVGLTVVSEQLWWTTAIAGSAGLMMCVGLWLLTKIEVISLPLMGRLQDLLQGLTRSAGALLRRPRLATGVVILALVGQCIVVAALWLLAKEMQVFLPLVDIVLVTLGAMLASAVPISVAGWGIREGTLVFLFGAYGVPSEKALAISLLFGACMMIAALPGAYFLIDRESKRIPQSGGPSKHYDHPKSM